MTQQVERVLPRTADLVLQSIAIREQAGERVSLADKAVYALRPNETLRRTDPTRLGEAYNALTLKRISQFLQQGTEHVPGAFLGYIERTTSNTSIYGPAVGIFDPASRTFSTENLARAIDLQGAGVLQNIIYNVNYNADKDETFLQQEPTRLYAMTSIVDKIERYNLSHQDDGQAINYPHVIAYVLTHGLKVEDVIDSPNISDDQKALNVKAAALKHIHDYLQLDSVRVVSYLAGITSTPEGDGPYTQVLETSLKKLLNHQVPRTEI